MKSEIEKQEFSSIEELKSFFQKSRVLLESARSTEPMMFNGMKYVAYKIKTEIKRCKNVQDLKRIIIKSFDEFKEIVKENDKRIIEY
jgi:translation initiation factor 2B subunit (eIF-2B alpha/beta/delta family)